MLDRTWVYEVIKRPIFTEKATGLRDAQKKIVVEVAPWASKSQVREAAKALFNVDVESVNTLNYRGKMKRVRNHVGKKSNTKRAYLTLKTGTDVDLFGMVGQETTNA